MSLALLSARLSALLLRALSTEGAIQRPSGGSVLRMSGGFRIMSLAKDAVYPTPCCFPDRICREKRGVTWCDEIDIPTREGLAA